jgi:hypothetical protein
MAGAVHAGSAVPIENPLHEAISSISGKPPSLDDVKTSPASAALARGWRIGDVAPGQAIGTPVVRDKRTVKVDIAYATNSTSIKYKDSINMKYGNDSAGQAFFIASSTNG